MGVRRRAPAVTVGAHVVPAPDPRTQSRVRPRYTAASARPGRAYSAHAAQRCRTPTIGSRPHASQAKPTCTSALAPLKSLRRGHWITLALVARPQRTRI